MSISIGAKFEEFTFDNNVLVNLQEIFDISLDDAKILYVFLRAKHPVSSYMLINFIDTRNISQTLNYLCAKGLIKPTFKNINDSFNIKGQSISNFLDYRRFSNKCKFFKISKVAIITIIETIKKHKETLRTLSNVYDFLISRPEKTFSLPRIPVVSDYSLVSRNSSLKQHLPQLYFPEDKQLLNDVSDFINLLGKTIYEFEVLSTAILASRPFIITENIKNITQPRSKRYHSAKNLLMSGFLREIKIDPNTIKYNELYEYWNKRKRNQYDRAHLKDVTFLTLDKDNTLRIIEVYKHKYSESIKCLQSVLEGVFYEQRVGD